MLNSIFSGCRHPSTKPDSDQSPLAVLKWRIPDQILRSSQIKIVFAGIQFFSSTLKIGRRLYCATVGWAGWWPTLLSSTDHAQMPRPENTRLWLCWPPQWAPTPQIFLNIISTPLFYDALKCGLISSFPAVKTWHHNNLKHSILSLSLLFTPWSLYCHLNLILVEKFYVCPSILCIVAETRYIMHSY